MKTLYIEPGAPWENPYSESFNSRFRDEFLHLEVFGSKLEAKVLGGKNREKYNHHRPHSSLGDLTPAEFAARCLAPLRPFDSVEAACAPQDSVINPKHQPNLSEQVVQILGALKFHARCEPRPRSAHLKSGSPYSRLFSHRAWNDAIHLNHF